MTRTIAAQPKQNEPTPERRSAPRHRPRPTAAQAGRTRAPHAGVAGEVPAVVASPATASLADRVGEGLASFEGIVIPTPPQQTAIRQMNSLRVMGLNQPEGEQRRAYRYLHQSGTGKSTCAKLLKRLVDEQPGRDPARKPILHVTLATTGTPKSLASSILDAMGDNYSTRGEAELLLRRVRQGIRENEVELLIIDELNHFRQKHLAKDAANTIKNILTLGWVPIVLMGTDEAQSLFADNRELKNRCAPQVVLAPYDPDDKVGDLPMWTKLLGGIDAQLTRRNILRRPSGLAEPTLAEDLCRASNGLIGELHNILLAALEATLLAGDDHISHPRLVEAVDAWCIQDGTIDRNFLKLNRNG